MLYITETHEIFSNTSSYNTCLTVRMHRKYPQHPIQFHLYLGRTGGRAKRRGEDQTSKLIGYVGLIGLCR